LWIPSSSADPVQELSVDIAIFGGGIAGLWSLARLRQTGYQAVLFERGEIGGVQTLASQGIIHGGSKYALTGKLTDASQAIAAMPGIWRDCLSGTGQLDLTGVRVLSPHQYLWSTGSISSGLAGFFAGKLMRSRVRSVAAAELPPPFDHAEFSGSLYQLQEPVLDVASLVKVLYSQQADYCWHLPSDQLRVDAAQPNVFSIGDHLRVSSQAILFAAGAGNKQLLDLWGRQQPAMQQRPLHMLMLKGDLPEVYAHCLGVSTNPRMTITSYPLDDGRMVWYLGGLIAEQGVQRDASAQISAGKTELKELLPWLDTSSLQWSAFRVNRAEPAMASGKRPDDCYLHHERGLFTAWPTKLAFAPRLAGKLLDALEAQGVNATTHKDLVGLQCLSTPSLSKPPWDQAAWS
jgi:glycerol-3-phosphate dehydrogenase